MLSRSSGELLHRVEMGGGRGPEARGDPLADPAAFHTLADRLYERVPADFDVIVVRGLVVDQVLGYELSLLSGKPVVVSYDEEGLIIVDGAERARGSTRALLVAGTHLTQESMRAMGLAAEREGWSVSGLALILRILDVEYPWPVYALVDES